MNATPSLSDTIIHKQVQVSVPPAQVWRKWTTKEGLLSFFPPECHVELRVGGAYEMYFLLDAPEGSRGSEGCKILSYLPEKMLSFSWNAPPTIPEVRDHEHKAWVVLTFQEEAEGTLVDLVHLGFLQGPAWEETIAYFDSAWSRVLERLQHSFD